MFGEEGKEGEGDEGEGECRRWWLVWEREERGERSGEREMESNFHQTPNRLHFCRCSFPSLVKAFRNQPNKPSNPYPLL